MRRSRSPLWRLIPTDFPCCLRIFPAAPLFSRLDDTCAQSRRGRALLQVVDRILNRGEKYDLLVLDENFGIGRTCGSEAILQLRDSWKATSENRPVVISCNGNGSDGLFTPEERVDFGIDAVWGKPTPDWQDGTMQAILAELLERRRRRGIVPTTDASGDDAGPSAPAPGSAARKTCSVHPL